MGGIEAYEEMTPEQLEAVSGGELLRQEAGNFMQVRNIIYILPSVWPAVKLAEELQFSLHKHLEAPKNYTYVFF